MTTQKENYIKELKEAWDITCFKHEAMNKVAADKTKTIFAYYFILAGAVLGVIGNILFGGPFSNGVVISVLNGVIQVAMSVIGIYVVSYIAKQLFKGHAKHDEFFRVMSYGMVVSWAGIFPAIAPLAGIWGLILVVVMLKVVHKLTTGKAILTLLITWIVMIMVAGILSPIYSRMGTFGMKSGAAALMDSVNK